MSKVIKIIVLWIVITLATVFLNIHKPLQEILLNWDGGHFIGIAENGYKYNFQYAFFPLFPIAIFFISKLLFIKALWAGILINFLAIILAIVLLYKLLVIDYSRKFSLKVILLILSFPLSFFFLLPYSESLFFLLTVASFYFAFKRKYKLACLLAGLSLITRPLGVATVIAVFAEIFIIQKVKTKSFFLLPLFILIYSLFLKIQTGDFFYTLTAEKHWQRSLSLPLENIWQNWTTVTSQNLSYLTLPVLTELVAVILSLSLLAWSYRKIKPSFFIYFLISLLLPLSTGKLTSLPRFLVVVFPLFIILGMLLRGYFFKVYLLISVVGLWFALGMFLSGYWVS